MKEIGGNLNQLKIQQMLQLLESCPLATKVIQEWFTQKMIEASDENIPEEVLEYMKEMGVPVEKLAELINISPRSLFDVLDENGVIVNVLYKNGSFSWYVNDTDMSGSNSIRVDSERAGIEHGIKLLNDKLDEGQNSRTSEGEVPTEE
jgi:hypothetical protein